jgi:hypothetical protein
MGKEKRKEKEKGFSSQLGRGGQFRPRWRKRARGDGEGERRCGVGTHAREGADGVNDTEGGAGARPGSSRRRAPRRFSAVGPVLWWGNGGEAWAVDGGHRGGANVACGGLGRPVRGTVAGARGSDAAGEVAGHNRGGEVAPCDRESVAELLA